jgi:spore coat protein U-like protein
MTALNFGNVDVLPGTAVDTTATITESCSGGGGNGQRVCISIGSGTVFTGSQRQLNGPSSAKLNYDLYTNSARTQLWGSWQTGFDTSGVQLDFAQNSTNNITVYARLFASQQTATPGSYTTTFTANPFMQYDDKGTIACPTGNRNSSTSTSASTTVLSTCNISATNVAFGSVGLLTANNDATGTVNAQCSNALPYTVSLNGGLTGASDPTQRKMAKGAEQITYGLYRDSARSQAWGSTVGTNTVSGTGSGLSQSLTTYGRVPSQATGSPGTYSDTIVATVTY